MLSKVGNKKMMMRDCFSGRELLSLGIGEAGTVVTPDFNRTSS